MITMSEVGGAIERVHVPTQFGIHLRTSALFGNNPMIGIALAEPFHNQLFTRAVSRRYEVVIALQLKTDTAMSHKNLPGFPGDFYGGVQKTVHEFTSPHLKCQPCVDEVEFPTTFTRIP